jgi:hypothetical protein
MQHTMFQGMLVVSTGLDTSLHFLSEVYTHNFVFNNKHCKEVWKELNTWDTAYQYSQTISKVDINSQTYTQTSVWFMDKTSHDTFFPRPQMNNT